MPVCLAVMYLEWRVLVRGDTGVARFLGGAGLLLAVGLLFSLGLAALVVSDTTAEQGDAADGSRDAGLS